MTSSTKIPVVFNTDRLAIYPLDKHLDRDEVALQTVAILSPEVTQSLPSGWQSVDTKGKAIIWLKERDEESTVLLMTSDSEVIGFIFLFLDDNSTKDALQVRFGYLLRRESWGKGIGTEVLGGFVEWARANKSIHSISGGVEKSNIGSIKVLKKVGFDKLETETVDTVFYQYRFH